MDSFRDQILSRRPLLIIVPYGALLTEIINILILSLHRSNIFNIHIDNTYQLEESIPLISEDQSDGICIMTTTTDYIYYTPDIIPIYLVEWGTRMYDIHRYQRWIHGYPLILYIDFIPDKSVPLITNHDIYLSSYHYFQLLAENMESNIVYFDNTYSLPDLPLNKGGWIPLNLDISRYSPKFASVLQYIDYGVIYCPYEDKNGISFLSTILSDRHIFKILMDDNDKIRTLNKFLHSPRSVLLTSDFKILSKVPHNVSIHIVNLDSNNIMSLIKGHHDIIHVYIALGPSGEETAETIQYKSLLDGIHDANLVYQNLLNQAKKLVRDKYNNLYIA